MVYTAPEIEIIKFVTDDVMSMSNGIPTTNTQGGELPYMEIPEEPEE